MIPHPLEFHALLKTARATRPFLPAALGRKIPKRSARPQERPAPRHPRKMLMLEGCVQPARSPNTNVAGAGAVVQTASGLRHVHLTAVTNARLRCGSAATYSITQPGLAERLRHNALDALESGRPKMIVTARIGCQTHLDGAGRTPVRHRIEPVEASLP